ncbi:MAG: hypothetical protein HKN91_15455, partial [Acidimicrobiia bacterium]|nr:hypothetical protein [Acidimicrobiia bacterium]
MTWGMSHNSEANTIRWDSSALTQLATACEGKAEQLLLLRRQALSAADEGGRPLAMRLAVIAALWAEDAATKLRTRRILLSMAENSLAAALGAVGPIAHAAWKPELRSRPVEDVQQDLQAALRAGREVDAAELTMELATAQRDSLLMSEEPD